MCFFKHKRKNQAHRLAIIRKYFYTACIFILMNTKGCGNCGKIAVQHKNTLSSLNGIITGSCITFHQVKINMLARLKYHASCVQQDNTTAYCWYVGQKLSVYCHEHKYNALSAGTSGEDKDTQNHSFGGSSTHLFSLAWSMVIITLSCCSVSLYCFLHFSLGYTGLLDKYNMRLIKHIGAFVLANELMICPPLYQSC